MKHKKKKFLIVGNWKNHPDSLADARKNFKIITAHKFDNKSAEVVVCPPVIYLATLAKDYKGKSIKFGTQNFYLNDDLPHTGEISTLQLNDLKISHSIIGHAERRLLGEDNPLIAKKLKDSISARITPILCIGEKERDSGGEYLKFLEEQLVKSLHGIETSELKKLVIAYEPVWAIGSNKYVSAEEIHKINIFIKKILSLLHNRKAAFSVPVLYGGSVDAENCQEILENGDIQGLLIGRASSNPYSFLDIIKKISKI